VIYYNLSGIDLLKQVTKQSEMHSADTTTSASVKDEESSSSSSSAAETYTFEVYFQGHKKIIQIEFVEPSFEAFVTRIRQEFQIPPEVSVDFFTSLHYYSHQYVAMNAN